MPILVQKYGGTSMANSAKLTQVAERVVSAKRRGYDLVVVVSAMGNTTDELLALAREVSSSPDGRELDMLVSVGERVSMALLSMAIHALGHSAISFTGSQSGILTNDNPGSARIIDVRPYRVQDELARGNIVIVAGYQGVSYRHEVTTLGRGGSDTTAVALAAALGAEACEIYSDVDGVYSADPRVVIDAKRLDTISYEEMLELARLGARVLHADAVEFARRAGIALHARRAFDDGDGAGTRIARPDGYPETLLREERAAYVTGVAGRSDVLMLQLGGEASANLLDAVSGLPLLHALVGPERSLALVATENVGDVTGLLRQLGEELGPTLSVQGELGLASAVGSRVGQSTDGQRRLLRALGEAGLVAHLSFTGRAAASAVVDSDRVEPALVAIHNEFL